jgi:FkbM family methyltransferase
LGIKFIRRFLPREIRRNVILSGPLRGMQIVTSWHDYPAAITGYTERALIDWFEENVRPGETWLDVGAHYGYTAIALSRLVGPSGRVFAFEPMITTAGYLAHTRWLNCLSQLTVLPLAVGCSESIALRQLPSVRGMVDSTIQETKDKSGNKGRDTILVVRLDWLWTQICSGQEHIDGVKIDVQGMEIEVLKGMSNILKSYKPKLVVEVHQGVDRDELLDVIEGAGYSRRAIPIEQFQGDAGFHYIDDRSYEFQAMSQKSKDQLERR